MENMFILENKKKEEIITLREQHRGHGGGIRIAKIKKTETPRAEDTELTWTSPFPICGPKPRVNPGLSFLAPWGRALRSA
jgi:hypothetical protein